MRPRAELAVALGLLLALGAFVAVDAWRTGDGDRLDLRRTTYRSTPTGARGWTEALERLGVSIDRLRRPSIMLEKVVPEDELLAYLDPTFPLDLLDATHLVARVKHGGSVLLAGRGARFAMRCFGWDRVAVEGTGVGAEGRVEERSIAIDAVQATLTKLDRTLDKDSIRRADLGVLICTPPAVARVDTLLRTSAGKPVVVRLVGAEGGTVIIVADGRLFADEMLRGSDAGVLALSLVVPAYRSVVVDEYHHGYGAAGSMRGALFQWSLHAPWGWALWQAAVVGVIALLTAMVRSGPLHQARSRRRRSPLEHVRALAQALAATRGHDVAVRLLVGGLRRRLSADGRPTRDDPTTWLAALASRMRTPRGRSAARTLQDLTRPGQSAPGVLAAANAVEAVWDETRP
ncbi:MAG: DUF4350 domain-containing protein [Gemmatimonadales bacterium]